MRKLILLIPAAIIAIVVLLWSQQSSGPYIVSGHIEADEIRLGSRVGGRVEDVRAIEGATVAAGDVLVVLEPYNLRETLAQAEATLAANRAKLDELHAGYRAEEVAQAQARRDRVQATLEKLKAGPRPLEISIKEANLRAAQAELVWAETEHERLKKLRENNQASKEELDQAIRRLDTTRAQYAAANDTLALAKEGTRAEEIAEAQASLAEADAVLTLQKNGYRQEDVAQAEAQVRAAEAAVAAIKRQLDELTIRAPSAGVVEAVDLQPGDLVALNAPVLTLLAAENLWVRAYIPEDRLDLKVGDELKLRVDAYPQRRFSGRVAFISRQAEFTPSNIQTPEERVKQMFRVKIRIEGERGELRAGMSVDVFLEPEK